MEVSTTTLYALITLIVSGVLSWIREWQKHRTWSKNGNDLKEIKDDVKTTNDKIDCLDKKMGETRVRIGEIKTAVNSQKLQCAATTTRFDKAIGDQNQQIIGLAKNSGRKH